MDGLAGGLAYIVGEGRELDAGGAVGGAGRSGVGEEGVEGGAEGVDVAGGGEVFQTAGPLLGRGVAGGGGEKGGVVLAVIIYCLETPKSMRMARP